MFNSENSFNVLYTAEVAKTHSFFEQLGVPIKEFSDEKVVVTLGSFDLHYILSTSEPFEDYEYITTPQGYGQGVIFYIETNNLEEASKRAIEAGGVLKSQIFENKWNAKEFLFEDPNGYKFALYQQ